MKKFLLLFIAFLFGTSLTFSQVFTELPSLEFGLIDYYSCAWGDVDNDNDLDLIVTGEGWNQNTFLYINQGENEFQEIAVEIFAEDRYVEIGFFEFNNDGKLDLIVTGIDGDPSIYLNNGDYTFSLQVGTDFYLGTNFDCADSDNDGDIDVLCSSHLYINEGTTVYDYITLPDIEGIGNGSVDFGDFDKDGDSDIVITGDNGWPGYSFAGVFENLGNNNFIHREDISLQRVESGQGSWGDYDNDGDLDILITGVQSSTGYIQVYKNNGPAGFSLEFTISEYEYYNFSAWGDYNNDGWLDFVVTDGDVTRVFKSISGTDFEEQSNESIVGFENGNLRFGDYDNDGDLDLLVMGDRNAKLYVNNTNKLNTKPEPPSYTQSSVDSNTVTLNWSRGSDLISPVETLSYNISLVRGIDDTIITPTSSEGGYRKIVDRGNMDLDTFYVVTNLSPGEYKWRVQTIDDGFMGSVFSQEQFFYVGGDAPIIAHSPEFPVLTETTTSFPVYIKNIGNTPLTYSISQEGDWFQLSETAGGDSTVLIVSCNENSGAYRKGKIILDPDNPSLSNYIIEIAQEGTFIFTEVLHDTFPGLSYASFSWGDFDNDNDLDLILTGRGPYTSYHTKLFVNKNGETMQEDTGFHAINVRWGHPEWNDYNNDGLLDLIISGSLRSNNESNYQTKLYKNNGDKTLTEQTNIELPGIALGSTTFGDYNNDGLPDLLLTGKGNNDQSITALYKNISGADFTKDSSDSFASAYLGEAKWFDYNKDGRLDFMVCGDGGYDGSLTRLYKNLGDNTFDTTNFPWTRHLSFIDLDEDNFADLFLGNDIYRSVNSESFEVLRPRYIPHSVLAHSWGDYDNDGDADILFYSYGIRKLILFENLGNYIFKLARAFISDEIIDGSAVQFVDYNNDGRLDFLVAGYNSSGKLVTQLYKNNYYRTNQAPTPPTELWDSTYAETVYLFWNNGNDTESAVNTLYYNFYLYNQNGDTIVNAMANKQSGFLKTITQGNANMNNEWHIQLQNPGTYLWSVQSIDMGQKGSVFATKHQFTINEFLAFKKSMENSNWQAGKSYPILWDEAFLAYVKLEYSINGGADWQLITDSINASDESLLWTVPELEPTECMLRISDKQFGLADTVVIQIVPNIELIKPLAGTEIQTSRILPISWNSSNSDYAKLHYRFSEDTNWDLIADSIASTESSYEWQLPEIMPGNYFIRVSDQDFPAANDSVAIIILPYLELLAPTENEKIIENSNYTISWKQYFADTLRIEYFDVNFGWILNTIANRVPANQLSYSWFTPDNPYSSDFRIIITDIKSSISDTSGVFTLVLSIDENGENPVFDLHPNPVYDILYISFQQTNENVDLKLFDLHGDLVFQTSLNSSPACKIDLSSVSRGTYILKLFFNNTSYSQKIILMK